MSFHIPVCVLGLFPSEVYDNGNFPEYGFLAYVTLLMDISHSNKVQVLLRLENELLWDPRLWDFLL